MNTASRPFTDGVVENTGGPAEVSIELALVIAVPALHGRQVSWYQQREPVSASALLRHELLEPLHQFVGGYLFLVRRDNPDVAKRILDPAGSIAVELIPDRDERLGAGVNRTPYDVVHVQVKVHGRSTDGQWTLVAPLRKLVADHHARIADLDFGVSNFTTPPG